jgi:hypothetical protein
MNEEPNNQPQPPPTTPNRERVIQPTASIVQELETQKQQVASQPSAGPIQSPAATAYTEPIKDIEPGNFNASQHIALASAQAYAQENDRPVSLRVKSLFVVAILSSLSAMYGLYAASTILNTSSFGIVLIAISLIQLAMSVYLFVGKDHNTVGLILKIYLVFQVISLFLSLGNPTGFVINGVAALFLFYVYTRVKSLSY